MSRTLAVWSLALFAVVPATTISGIAASLPAYANLPTVTMGPDTSVPAEYYITTLYTFDASPGSSSFNTLSEKLAELGSDSFLATGNLPATQGPPQLLTLVTTLGNITPPLVQSNSVQAGGGLTSSTIQSVPEPGTIVLSLLGLIAAISVRRFRKTFRNHGTEALPIS